MNQDISIQLAKIAGDLVPWDNLDATWQAKIKPILHNSPSPDYFISPDSEIALSEILQYAHQHNYSLLICGQGSKLDWGGLLKKPVQLVVSTQNLNQIIEYAAEDLTVTVEAGVKLADLQQTLQQTNQFLPLDPSYGDMATIGGIVATADAGSWRQRYGGVRDLLLGITFVRGDGAMAKAGGRVVKNVAGYDLMKLFTGSYGTLGIISQVTLRVYPIPDSSLTILLTGEANNLNKAQKIILNCGLTPTVIDLISPGVVKQLDITPNPGLLLRLQTIPESIKVQGEQIEKIAQQFNLSYQTYQDEIETNLWQRLKKISESPDLITCKIGIIRDCAQEFLTEYTELTNQEGIAIIHAGSGLGKLAFNAEDPIGKINKLRLLCQNKQGFLTILTAPNTIKQSTEIWGYTGNGLPIMEKLKKQFDSNSLLNPGRFLGNI